MKLSNGAQITTIGKPHLQGASYTYKDTLGRENKIPRTRVLEMMPASMAKEEEGRFKPSAK